MGEGERRKDEGREGKIPIDEFCVNPILTRIPEKASL